MSIKKLLILSAAGFAAVTSAAAFAGGPDEMPQSLFTPAIYVDAHGGYDWYNWKQMVDNVTTVFNNQGNMGNNADGGWIGGLDIGLQVFKNVAFEVGGFYLPKVTGETNQNFTNSATGCGASVTTGATCVTGSQYNWMAYAAGKFSVDMPYVEGLDMFAKVGAVWRGMSNEQQIVPGRAGMKSYWDVIYGAGFEYELMQTGFRLGVQWLRIPGYIGGTENPSLNAASPAGAKQSKLIAARQPAQDLLTGSVGYKFDF